MDQQIHSETSMNQPAPHQHNGQCCTESVPVVQLSPGALQELKPDKQGWLDRLGAGLGIACAIHCLAMPLLVGVLPLLGLAFVAEERFEWAVVSTVSILALASALWGYQKHRALRVVMSFVGALGVLVLGLWLDASTDWGHLFVVLGGVGVAGAHLLSARLCQRCEDDDVCCT